MTPQESELVDELFNRLVQLEPHSARRAVAAGVRRAVLRREVAPQRRSLWDRARGSGAGHLSAHAVESGDRPLEHDQKSLPST